MKKTFKVLLSAIAIFVAAPLIYIALAFGLSRIPASAEVKSGKDVPVYILSNGVHTDIVVPVKNSIKDWSQDIRYEYTMKKDTTFKFLALGWGDKGFYLDTPTWADLKASTAFRAAFSLSTSAIHATFYRQLREGPNCVKLTLSWDQYERLVNYIQNSFQSDKDARFIRIITKANYGSDDAFYEAKGSYSLLHTCNTWANNALKSCGQKACWWTPFDKGIFYQYRKDSH